MLNPRKVAVIGCGFVGASIAFSLMQTRLFSEMVLLDANQAKAEGEAMDLSHGLPYASEMDLYAGTYQDLADSALTIITAGANQKPGESRLNLIERNVKILQAIIPQITATSFEGILMVVSNPVDILTYEAQRISGYPIHRVIGSGTVLDTARLKYLLSRFLKVDSRNVHAMIIGEHGDSELAVWSRTNISGIDLADFCKIRGHQNYEAEMEHIYKEVRNGAYEIISRKGATYYCAGPAGRFAGVHRAPGHLWPEGSGPQHPGSAGQRWRGACVGDATERGGASGAPRVCPPAPAGHSRSARQKFGLIRSNVGLLPTTCWNKPTVFINFSQYVAESGS